MPSVTLPTSFSGAAHMSATKSPLRAFLMIALTALTAHALAADVVLPGTPYSLALPGTPSCDTAALSLPMGIEIPAQCSATLDGHTYSFDYMVLPNKIPRDQAAGAMFAAALGRAVAMDGSIGSKTSGKYAGLPSLDFTINGADGAQVAFGRYVVIKNHLVRVLIDSSAGNNAAPLSSDEVLGSLILKKRKRRRARPSN